MSDPKEAPLLFRVAPNGIGLWPLFLLTLVGCAAPKGTFLTKKDSSYQGKVQRVLIVYQKQSRDAEPALNRRFSDRLVSQLAELLRSKEIPSEVACFEQDELDRDANLKAAAAPFGPTQLLSFGITRLNEHVWLNNGVTRMVSVGLELRLIDYRTGKTVWRTQATYGIPPDPENAAAELLGQLVADHFL
jgi:hypothetical protein